ncbi:putative transferase CAF17 homolog, mitochondrial isoform X1 [Polypterus senegalus]|nr:putative transferase CAF17 homolog, mitochondrial isoform X1 [Polypterus senegalus]
MITCFLSRVYRRALLYDICRRSLFRVYRRAASYSCYELTHRQLLSLRGEDTIVFLQGLITNDAEQLNNTCECRTLYAHLLNVQGRTLFDVLLYSVEDSQMKEHFVLLEHDNNIKDLLQKHMLFYKIRRKVSIVPCSSFSVWSVLPSEPGKDKENILQHVMNSKSALFFGSDPRTAKMGWRLIVENQVNPLQIIPDSRLGDIGDYHRHRYTLGLPEGVKDLPPGGCLPLESNLAYMNGVSFTKGCYIGQELTARTHHTGVIRKRLMPVQFLESCEATESSDVVTETRKPVGKLRSCIGDLGLALLRQVNTMEKLFILSTKNSWVQIKAGIPDWWPKDDRNI